MILHADTDASYLTEPETCSRTSGYFFLGSIPSKCAQESLNITIHVNCNILKSVATSAAESETGISFVTGRYVIILRSTLEEIGHPNPITKLFMENMAADVITNNTMKQQKTRAMNMQYFWIRDQKTLIFSHCMEIRTSDYFRLFYEASFCKTS